MRRVLLLSVTDDTREIEDLLASLRFPILRVIKQNRNRPDPATFLGRGKVREAKLLIPNPTHPMASDGRPLVVVNADLRPPQLFNLEEALGVEVWDRIRLILEIFKQKAEVREARLQVELARLRYELPFVHEALHRQLKGEHPGFMGGGEVEARTYETQLKQRTRSIQLELERVKRERRTRRAGRRKGGFQLVALAGYTNSGKSSLLNALCGSTVLVEDRVFSTLQTTTRRLRTELTPRRPYNLLFTDTVGFIRNLPPWLVNAFASTLEEITFADVVALVADTAEPFHLLHEKVTTALDVLHEVGAPKRIVLLLNKADLLETGQRETLLHHPDLQPLLQKYPYMFVSAVQGENLQDFVNLLLNQVLPSRRVHIRIDPALSAHASFAHWVYDHADVLHDETLNGRRTLQVRCGLETWGPLLREARRANAAIEASASTGN